jgi:hypothetical protein
MATKTQIKSTATENKGEAVKMIIEPATDKRSGLKIAEDVKALARVAKSMGLVVTIVSDEKMEDLEDAAMIKAMKEADRSKTVSKDKVMSALRS